MRRACVVGLSVVLVSCVAGQTPCLAGHGHGGGHGGNAHGGTSHTSKPAHEAPKHSSKPAQHPPKPAPKPQSKPAPKPHPKPANPQGARKDANAHKNPSSKQGEHNANPNPADKQHMASGSHEQHHVDEHHEHEHHHDRWVNGHRHYWSEQGFWVDATTGLPVPEAAVAVPADGSDSGVAAPSAPVAPGRRQSFFNIQPSDLDSYDAAAAAAGLSRDEWIRSRLSDAVRRELK